MQFDELSDELKDKVMKATTPEEIKALAKDEGFNLTDDQLEAVSGGWCRDCNSYCMSDCGTM